VGEGDLFGTLGLSIGYFAQSFAELEAKIESWATSNVTKSRKCLPVVGEGGIIFDSPVTERIIMSGCGTVARIERDHPGRERAKLWTVRADGSK